MIEGLPVPIWVLAAAAAIVIVLAFLISNAVSERELSKRAQRLSEAEDGSATEAPPTAFGTMLAGIGRIGNALRGSFLFAQKDIETIERTARAAGLDPARAVPLVIAGKVILLVAGPVIGYVLAISWNLSFLAQALVVMIGMVLGTFLPNWLLAFAIKSHQDSLRKGLPDALDLLVVCAEAGLGLESALERVATEMNESNPSIAAEFNTLLADMRIATDRRAALTRLGERTGLASFQRLGSTLSQTLRYGTPVGQALRVLAAEMRTERMVRIEEKAARLPALLVLPMILFILPCLFIVLGGPAALRILDVVGG